MVAVVRGGARKTRGTDQLEDGDLHHALIKVGWLVFDDLDGYNLVGLHVLAFYHLTKGALAEYIKNEVPEEKKVSDGG